MMRATLTNDRFCLEVAVAGYEFPDVLDDVEDANWLVIRVSLQSVHGAWRWQVEDAGALTWELADCIRWLQDLSNGQSVADETFSFSEPDIRFEAIRHEGGHVVGLAVHLMDEFQPPTKVLVPRENNEVTLRFHTPPDVLRAFAGGLSASLAQFPQRGALPEV
ncbi:MAG: hypothetical protein HZC41_13140 [Chloroflexi bacterium]|nr:hypothetical protein [Chloroflexota bacterium]